MDKTYGIRLRTGAFAALVTAAGLTAAPLGLAHHSFNASFDGRTVVELEGEVGQVRWRNPHVSFDLHVPAEDGSVETYDVETLAMSGLRRRDIFDPFVAAGDHVRVAGNPSRRGTQSLYLQNILLPTGQEILLQSDAEPRFEAARHDGGALRDRG